MKSVDAALTEVAWHSRNSVEVMDILRTASHGLSEEEAKERLEQYGPNELEKVKGVSAWGILLGQFRNVLMMILIAATIISAAIGEWFDAMVIAVILFFCIVLGFIQEYRSEKALEALKKMLSPTATVVRDGKEVIIPAREIVPGDILTLKEGVRIPADARLIKITNLQVNEAPLTGESVPVTKDIKPLSPETLVTDRRNMVFCGTEVTYGKGESVVTDTGMNTEFGKIAKQVVEVKKEKTPLERKVGEIGKWLSVILLGVCTAVVAAGLLEAFLAQGYIKLGQILDVGMFGVALAVAAVPEALPAIVVGSLAIATHTMAKRNAFIRKLAAVETLGCTTVICSDKTGTLTKGEMTARSLYICGKKLSITGIGYEPTGEFKTVATEKTGSFDEKKTTKNEAFSLLMQGSLLCNDSRLSFENNVWQIAGDPTEGAMVVMATKAGLQQEDVRKLYPRVGEVPFSSERKRMTTIHAMPDSNDWVMFMKGAPEVVLETSSQIHEAEGVKELTDEQKKEILKVNDEMAKDALRVLALAYKKGPAGVGTGEEIERDMVFLGLVGMIDPPREEAVEAIRVCKSVGIKPVMITGDHKLTAVAIAKEMGIYRDDDVVLTGGDLEKISDENLAETVHRVSVYARVSPMHKLKIVKAWKRRGQVVAMTGDGVNDAPALKHSDIGVAMGITGTEVTKEASDMVLADDNFATIVGAVERGRWIYDNIKKYLAYLLQANLVEIIVLATAFLTFGRLPLEAKHILYINLATDGLPAIALGLSPPDPDIMKRPPRDAKESVFTVDVTSFLVRASLVEAPLLLGLWMFAPQLGFKTPQEQLTVLFLAFIFCELVVALNCRSLRFTVLKVKPHKWLLAAVAWETFLILSLVYLIPGVAEALELERIPLHDYWVIAITVTAIFVSMEGLKLVITRILERREVKRRAEVAQLLGEYA